jgi:hypothetical protein
VPERAPLTPLSLDPAVASQSPAWASRGLAAVTRAQCLRAHQLPRDGTNALSRKDARGRYVKSRNRHRPIDQEVSRWLRGTGSS